MIGRSFDWHLLSLAVVVEAADVWIVDLQWVSVKSHLILNVVTYAVICRCLPCTRCQCDAGPSSYRQRSLTDPISAPCTAGLSNQRHVGNTTARQSI